MNNVTDVDESHLTEFLDKLIIKHSDDAIYIFSENNEVLIESMQYLMANNISTILTPFSIMVTKDYKIFGSLQYFVKEKGAGSWVLGMFTSGSTGQPKLFVFSQQQINITLGWYKDIYDGQEDVVILTSMPITYNFTFIAGVLNATNFGGKFQHSEPEDLVSEIVYLLARGRRPILLGNPVLLDILADEIEKTDVNLNGLMIDSGGAPLTTQSIRWFADHGVEMHEGYGLTETNSLTHFIRKVTDKTIGTVGPQMVGVETNIVQVDGKPTVQLTAPTIGSRLSEDNWFLTTAGDTYLTTDIGRIQDGNLTLLGRSSDEPVNGFWPKETMEIVGAYLPNRCVLVEQAKSKVYLKFWSHIDKDTLQLIKKNIKQKLNLAESQVMYTVAEDGLLHSMKMRRQL